MKKIKGISLIALATLTLGLGACNTLKGAGQDIERGGEAIQNAAS